MLPGSAGAMQIAVLPRAVHIQRPNAVFGSIRVFNYDAVFCAAEASREPDVFPRGRNARVDAKTI